jgi:hypothetical protein
MALGKLALSNRDVAVDRLSCDPLGDLRNVGLLASMTGSAGAVPFECAGLPVEVLACLRNLLEREANLRLR